MFNCRTIGVDFGEELTVSTPETPQYPSCLPLHTCETLTLLLRDNSNPIRLLHSAQLWISVPSSLLGPDVVPRSLALMN